MDVETTLSASWDTWCFHSGHNKLRSGLNLQTFEKYCIFITYFFTFYFFYILQAREQILKYNAAGKHVAAAIVEPIQAEGGIL